MYAVFSKELSVNSVPHKEILRYMRAREANGTILQVVSEAERLVLDAASCRACWTRIDIKKLSEDALMIGNIEMVSADLSKRLLECDEVFLFAATVGVGVDRVIRASEVKSPLLFLACDAAGSALVEELCDELCKSFDADVKNEKKHTLKRFSAGYGDLSLEYQKQICELLDTPKNIGAALTDGVMMTPSKTVTAIVGIKG